jgi:hypothetical protein
LIPPLKIILESKITRNNSDIKHEIEIIRGKSFNTTEEIKFQPETKIVRKRTELKHRNERADSLFNKRARDRSSLKKKNKKNIF